MYSMGTCFVSGKRKKKKKTPVVQREAKTNQYRTPMVANATGVMRETALSKEKRGESARVLLCWTQGGRTASVLTR